MDTFDVNLLSHVQALSTKLSISQEHLHPKKKALNEEKGKGRHQEKVLLKKPDAQGREQPIPADEDKANENIINITV